MTSQRGKSQPAFLERDGWKRNDKWVRQGEAFTVEVVRSDGVNLDGEVENKWCVYIYVYPKHPTFRHFNPAKGIFDNAHFECHSYASYYRAHRNNEGEIVSHQLGWDYMHDGDYGYSQYGDADSASSVFYDASRLFDEAKERHEEARAALAKANGEGV